jgi:hypothetical protein
LGFETRTSWKLECWPLNCDIQCKSVLDALLILYHLYVANQISEYSILHCSIEEQFFFTPQVHDTSEHTTSAAMVLEHLYTNWMSISPSSGNIHPTNSQRRTLVGWNGISDMMVCHFFLRFQQFHHYVQRCNTDHQLYRADATRNK